MKIGFEENTRSIYVMAIRVITIVLLSVVTLNCHKTGDRDRTISDQPLHFSADGYRAQYAALLDSVLTSRGDSVVTYNVRRVWAVWYSDSLPYRFWNRLLKERAVRRVVLSLEMGSPELTTYVCRALVQTNAENLLVASTPIAKGRSFDLEYRTLDEGDMKRLLQRIDSILPRGSLRSDLLPEVYDPDIGILSLHRDSVSETALLYSCHWPTSGTIRSLNGLLDTLFSYAW